MRPARTLAFTVIALTLAWAGSALGTSSTISYQGKLTTSGGAPVADGNYAVVFTLWTDSVGGSLIWTELQDVHVTGGEGLFTCLLGNLQPLGGPLVIHADLDLYLQTAVSGEVLVPRLALGSVPRAFSSSSVHHVEPGVGAMEMSVGDDTTRITASHQGFSNLLDSYVHLTDDHGMLGLKSYNPTLQYVIGDAVIMNDNIAQRTLGYDDDADGTAEVSVWGKVDNTEAVTGATIDLDDDGVPDVGTSSSAKLTRNTLKTFFQSGGTPNQSRVIDSVDATGAYVSIEAEGPDASSTSDMKVRIDALEAKLQSIGLLARSSITNTLTPTTSGVAINTKGTGADKGRTIGGTCDDSSAVQVLEIDDDGDGIVEGRGIISVKGATGSGSASASTQMSHDSDDDGVPETMTEAAVDDKFAQVRGFKVDITGARKSFGSSADSAGVSSHLEYDGDDDGQADFSGGGVVNDTSSRWSVTGLSVVPGNHADGWNVLHADGFTRTQLKDEFQNGDIPTQDQVVDSGGSTFRAINTKGTGATVRVGMFATDSAASECAVDSDGDGTAESQANIAALLNGNVVIGCMRDSDDDGVADFSGRGEVNDTSSQWSVTKPGVVPGNHRDGWNVICVDAGTRQTLKDEFQNGDIPTQDQVVDSGGSTFRAINTKGTGATVRVGMYATDDAVSECALDSDGDGTMESKANIGALINGNTVIGCLRDSDDDGAADVSVETVVNDDSALFQMTALSSVLPSTPTIAMAATPTGVHMEVGAATCDGTNWNNASDVTLKENFKDVDGESLLRKISGLEITQWNYKGDTEHKHIGPTAQDFKQIFGVGSDGKSISTIDPSGIALAAIKELNRQNRTLLEASGDLAAQNRTLMEQNALLKQQMEELARKVERLAAAR